ncbi:MAG: heavy-metal-associated domain-containing protein [Campylobacteraceae bacterium]|nr:heavy-metal-associated domain-containing protein [Campylobacteraceae bacterium]
MRKFIVLILFTCFLFGAKVYEIRVAGMHCPLCTAMVRKAVLKVDGVIKARATLENTKVVVEAEDNVTKESLLEAIATTGYSGEFIE